jgi:hypothetical protein
MSNYGPNYGNYGSYGYANPIFSGNSYMPYMPMQNFASYPQYQSQSYAPFVNSPSYAPYYQSMQPVQQIQQNQVYTQPLTCEIYFQSQYLAPGRSLIWHSIGATTGGSQAVISPNIGRVTPDGFITVPLDGARYTLTIRNDAGQSTSCHTQ